MGSDSLIISTDKFKSCRVGTHHTAAPQKDEDSHGVCRVAVP